MPAPKPSKILLKLAPRSKSLPIGFLIAVLAEFLYWFSAVVAKLGTTFLALGNLFNFVTTDFTFGHTTTPFFTAHINCDGFINLPIPGLN